MPRGRASSVSKSSMPSTLPPRYIVGDKVSKHFAKLFTGALTFLLQDHRSQISPNSDEYDDTYATGSKRIGLAWYDIS